LQSGPWSHRKDFLGVKNKPSSRGHVSVCLDLAGVVIDRMTRKKKSEGKDRPLTPKGRAPAKATANANGNQPTATARAHCGLREAACGSGGLRALFHVYEGVGSRVEDQVVAGGVPGEGY